MSRRSKRGGGGHDEGQERWLLTYADMITLLLALFIILFSMSTIDPVRFEELKQVLSQEFKGNITTGSESILEAAESPFSPDLADRVEDRLQQLESSLRDVKGQELDSQEITEIEQEVAQATERLAREGKIEQLVTERGLVIRLAGDTLFASGSAELRPAARADIVHIAEILATHNRNLSIDGHTDGQPINSGRYPSNWELSTARAATVGRLLLANGIAGKRIQLSGFADTRPVVKPTSAKQSIARNRRVEIVIKSRSASSLDGSGSLSPAPSGPVPNSANSDSATASIRPVEKPINNVIGPVVDVGR